MGKLNYFSVFVQKSSPYRKWKAFPVILIIFFLLIITTLQSHAQEDISAKNKIDGFPVVLDGKTLFQIKQGIPNFVTAKERADVVSQRLAEVAEDSSIPIADIYVKNKNDLSIIKAGSTTLLTVRDIDAKAYDLSREELAKEDADYFKSAIQDYRNERSVKQVTLGLVFAFISTVVIIAFLRIQHNIFHRLRSNIHNAYATDKLSLWYRNFRILGRDSSFYLLSGLTRFIQMILVLTSFYFYLPFLLGQVPATKSLANSLWADISLRFEQLGQATMQALPNLITLVLIGLTTYYVIGFAKLLISELGRDDVYPWFYPDWVQPTIWIGKFLIIAAALMISTPYIPGFGSPAFQGFSIFLGALFTFGSSTAVANTVAGIILIYTRAFEMGDIVKIESLIGKVIEKSLLVTRITTSKKEIITIPNSKVLGSEVINFSAIFRESHEHLLLHTTITFGYDIPWRKVHDILEKAAVSTEHILLEPYPFVLQTSLNDFNISYEINAYTDRPDLMGLIYSKLHQNIQDSCNEAGIEILSPSYSAIRDGNHSTMPSDYLPEDYQPPAFQIRNQLNSK